MKIGDIVNIIKRQNEFWKGRVTKIQLSNEVYSNTLYIINGIDNPGHAIMNDKDLEFRDGEYYEKNG